MSVLMDDRNKKRLVVSASYVFENSANESLASSNPARHSSYVQVIQPASVVTDVSSKVMTPSLELV